jgi:hypothetical protein
MNIAHMKSKAAASDRSTGHALVRRVAAGLLGLAVLSSAALAGPGRDQRNNGNGWQADAMRQGPVMQQRQYEDRQGRQYRDERDNQRADEQRRRMQDQQQAEQQEFRRSGRLTPDERRDLRRQINEAGADIYQRPKRR